MDGVRVGKPPGARGGIQILGMVREEWLRLAPQAYGGGAGCWVIAGTWPPPGGSYSPSSKALRVGTPSFAFGAVRGYSFAFVLGRGFSFSGGSVRGFNLVFVPVRGVLVWAVAQLPRAQWLLRVVGRCVQGRVLLRSVRSLFFCVAAQSCVSLQSVAYLSLSLCSQQIVSGCSHALLVRWAFEVEPSKVSVTSPSEPVSIDVRASWLGFVGVSCPRFCLTFVSVLGFPRVLSPVWVALSGSCPGFHLDTDSDMAVFVLGHSMELCREVGALTCGCLRWPACWLPCNSLHAVMGYG